MKELKCRDFGVDCSFETQGQTDAEVIAKHKEHALKFHKEKLQGMSDQEINQMLQQKIRETVNK
jgi:predicted small metal-binding protein